MRILIPPLPSHPENKTVNKGKQIQITGQKKYFRLRKKRGIEDKKLLNTEIHTLGGYKT